MNTELCVSALALQAVFVGVVPWILGDVNLWWNRNGWCLPDSHGGIPWLLQWVGYPVAFYRIFRYESNIADVSNFKEDVGRLLDLVERSQEIPSERIAFLSDETCEEIQWEYVGEQT